MMVIPNEECIAAMKLIDEWLEKNADRFVPGEEMFADAPQDVKDAVAFFIDYTTPPWEKSS